MNTKRGMLIVVLMLVILVSSLVSAASFKYHQDQNTGFNYAMALAVYGVDDDDTEGCNADESAATNPLSFSAMDSEVTPTGTLRVDLEPVTGGGSYACLWDRLPLDRNGCFFLSQENDQGENRLSQDCAGWYIPPGDSSLISTKSLRTSPLTLFFGGEASQGMDQSFFTRLGLTTDHQYVIQGNHWVEDYGNQDNAVCLFNSYLFSPTADKAFICLPQENQHRWYVCDATVLSDITGKYVPIDPVAGSTEKQGWFCTKNEEGYLWEPRSVTCDDLVRSGEE